MTSVMYMPKKRIFFNNLLFLCVIDCFKLMIFDAHTFMFFIYMFDIF